MQLHRACPPSDPKLELRAYSMEPHGISSKAACRAGQGRDACPEPGAGTIKIQDGGRAGEPVLVFSPSRLLSLPPGPSLPPWLLCCRRAGQSVSPTTPFAAITAFPERTRCQRPPLVSTSRCPAEDQILRSHQGLHIHLHRHSRRLLHAQVAHVLCLSSSSLTTLPSPAYESTKQPDSSPWMLPVWDPRPRAHVPAVS